MAVNRFATLGGSRKVAMLAGTWLSLTCGFEQAWAGGDETLQRIDHIADLLQKLEHSPQWPRMMVIVTYDENGGFWDHVPPPCGRLDPGIGVKPLTGSARFPICLEPNPRMN
jgi:Phosphoesterase family